MGAPPTEPVDDSADTACEAGRFRFVAGGFRERDVFRVTPHIHAAAASAEATSTLTLARFADVLADDSTWTRGWASTRHDRRPAILRSLEARFREANLCRVLDESHSRPHRKK